MNWKVSFGWILIGRKNIFNKKITLCIWIDDLVNVKYEKSKQNATQVCLNWLANLIYI